MARMARTWRDSLCHVVSDRDVRLGKVGLLPTLCQCCSCHWLGSLLTQDMQLSGADVPHGYSRQAASKCATRPAA